MLAKVCMLYVYVVLLIFLVLVAGLCFVGLWSVSTSVYSKMPLWTRFGLELMPIGWALPSRVMTPSWGEGGLKARARDPAPPDSPPKKLKNWSLGIDFIYYICTKNCCPPRLISKNSTLAFMKAACPQSHIEYTSPWRPIIKHICSLPLVNKQLTGISFLKWN